MKQDVVTVIKFPTLNTKNNMNNDIKYMKIALEEAEIASSKGEVPVGAVIVKDDKIIAKAHNLRQTKKSVLAHAEIIAIQKASKKLNSWILEGCTLYVTVEPCLMCAGTILQSRIDKVVYGTNEPKFGSLGSVIDISKENGFNHQLITISGVLKNEASDLMKSFFKELRQNTKTITLTNKQ